MKKRLLEYFESEDALLRFMLGAALTASIGSLLLNLIRAPQLGDEFALWWEHWLQHLSGQLFGGALMLLALEYVMRRRRPSTANPTPVSDATTPDPKSPTATEMYLDRLKSATSREARQLVLDEMKKQNLLIGANLNNLDLSGANFYDADMRGISLEGANLTGAYMIEANLQNAKLSEANLEKAELSWADLGGAFLGGVRLYGTWLLRANLEGTFIKTAHFDISTRLPDGTRWSQEADLERYTDPNHAKFWRPEAGFFGEYPRWFQKKQGR